MRHPYVLLASVICLATAALGAAAAAGAPAISITIVRTGDRLSHPTSITSGPDGALWYIDWRSPSDAYDSDEYGGYLICRIATTGAARHCLSGKSLHPARLTTGPDGALWFSDTHVIGRVTTGGKMTLFRQAAIGFAQAITTGPDGALWFVNMRMGPKLSIGRITVKGHVTIFRDARLDTCDGGESDITRGSDGALWFTACYSIGRITTAGKIRIFPLRKITSKRVTVGRDGFLWFTGRQDGEFAPGEFGRSIIGRMTTRGALTVYHAKGIDDAYGITRGPDGAVWFTNMDPQSHWLDSIGRITRDGRVSVFRNTRIAGASDIVTGSDGALWFTNEYGASVGRIRLVGHA